MEPSVTCVWKNVGTFPAHGVLMTLGTSGYGPGPTSQGLGPGARISINGREARMIQEDNGGSCLGVGASSSLGITVNDGEDQGVFNASFCFSGPNEAVRQNQAKVVVSTLHLRSDPTASGLV